MAPQHQHRLGQVVEQGAQDRLRLRGGEVTARQTRAQDARAPRGDGRQVLPDVGAEFRERSRPDDRHHPEQLPVPLPQRQHGARPARRTDDRPLVRTAGGPPQVRAAAGDPLRGEVRLRRNVPPAAGLPAGQAGLAEQGQGAVGFQQPEHDRRRAQRGQHLRGQRAHELSAIGGQFGGGLGPERTRLGGATSRRLPAPREPSPSAAGLGSSWARTAAAISPSDIPVAADRFASWPAASAEDKPSRSISAPRAIAMTDWSAAAARMRSSSRRWRSMTAISRVTSSSLPGTIVNLSARRNAGRSQDSQRCHKGPFGS